MTEPTLTEDGIIDKGIVIDHTLSNGELSHGYIQFHYNGTIEQAENQREKILTALAEYPKLKEEVKIRKESLLKCSESFDELFKQNQKLKAECEKLKKRKCWKCGINQEYMTNK